MPRKGENIYKRKDGRWEARMIRGRDTQGKIQYKYVYGSTYRETREKLAEAIRQKPAPPVPTGAPTVFSDAAAQWLAARKSRIKDSTYARYDALLADHLLPRFGNVKINDIDTSMIEGYTQALLRCGRKDGKGGLSEKTAADILMVLKSVIRSAEKRGVRCPADLREVTVRRPCKPIRVLTIQEQRQLTEYLTGESDRRRIGVFLSLYTGMRLGEVCALKWMNINSKERMIRVRSTMYRMKNYSIGENKTCIVAAEPKSDRSVRDIPIPDFLIPLLQQLRSSDEMYILANNMNKYIEPRSLEYYFKSCIKKAGIAPANYHSLRHTFATRCVEAGVDIKSLSEILGHSNVSTTLSLYVHSSFELKLENVNKLERVYNASHTDESRQAGISLSV